MASLRTLAARSGAKAGSEWCSISPTLYLHWLLLQCYLAEGGGGSTKFIGNKKKKTQVRWSSGLCMGRVPLARPPVTSTALPVPLHQLTATRSTRHCKGSATASVILKATTRRHYGAMPTAKFPKENITKGRNLGASMGRNCESCGSAIIQMMG